MKLWQKEQASLKEVERFTVGNDRQFDMLLASYDISGSIAHVTMLETVGLLSRTEKEALVTALRELYLRTLPGAPVPFVIQDDVEDVHSQVELLLTDMLGDTGKKIHAARSRNDQVLLDVKLYLRQELESTVTAIQPLFALLQAQSVRFKDALLPGYTHLQVAMPSSFGLWFGAYAEALTDDLITLQAAYEVVNKNPLGSAAGYGSSFPIDRSLTTKLLGFATLNYNVVYAQMGRGKAERIVAQALANVADTLARLSMDMCLYLSQNFGFVSFPAALTTGSSIMPHKKNPDVFELIRGKCNMLKALPNEIMLLTTNLPSGYHRDLQLLKEHLFPAFGILRDCLGMAGLMLGHVEVTKDILQDPKYRYAFSVEEVNRLVLAGVPFRDAYREVGLAIESSAFSHTAAVQHTHEGSIGNLCNEQVALQFQQVLDRFSFDTVHTALAKLTAGN